MSENNLVDIEREKVDNYILTACITLISAFIIIISINTPKAIFISISYLVSLFFLIVTILLSLWHKVRFQKRKQIYEQHKNKVFKNFSEDIVSFVYNFVYPLAYTKVDKLQQEKPGLTFEEYKKEVMAGEFKENTMKVVDPLLEKFKYQIKEKSLEAFNKPLNEKYAKIKFYLDRIASSTRYGFFIIGIIFFFVSLFLTLIYK